MKKILWLMAGVALIPSSFAAAKPDYQQLVSEAYVKFQAETGGKVADYIPALASYSPRLYGIALVTVDGKVYTAGDSKVEFPLESLSKIFNLALALKQLGESVVLEKVGSSATGHSFNSVVAVEEQQNRTGNSLDNAGAMATVSLLKAANAEAKWDMLAANLNDFAGAKLKLNDSVYSSEMATNQHNQAIALLLKAYGRLYDDESQTVDLYTRACSVDVNVLELAKMGAVFANFGKSPVTGQQIIAPDLVPKVLAEMIVAGLYENSGTWLYKVGIPAKSGVSGGIVAIVPGKFALAVYSPALDAAGNSVRAQKAIAYIAKQTKSNLFRLN